MFWGRMRRGEPHAEDKNEKAMQGAAATARMMAAVRILNRDGCQQETSSASHSMHSPRLRWMNIMLTVLR